jgi:MFS family permease
MSRPLKPFSFLAQIPFNTRFILFAAFFGGLSGGITEANFTYFLLANGFDSVFIATLAALGTLTGGIVSIPMGLLVDKIGRKWSIFIAQLISFPMFVIQVFLPVSPVIMTATVVATIAGMAHGLSEGPLLVESTNPEKRVNVLSMIAMTNLGAVIVGNFIGGKLTWLASLIFDVSVDSIFAYRCALVVAMCLSTVAISFYLRLKPVPAAPRPAMQGSNIFVRLFGNVKSWKFIWKLLLGQFLIGFGAGFTVPLFALYFKKIYNTTADQWGTLASISKFPYFFGMYITPIIAKRFGNLKTVIACQYLSIPFLLLTLFAPSFWIAGVGFAIRNALMNMTGPVWSSFWMGVCQPSELSTVSSFVTVGWNVLNSTGTRIGGQLLEDGRHWISFTVTGCTYLIASTFYLIFMQKHEREKLRESQ